MNIEKFKKNKKYIVINLLLFAFLYFSVSFNKEYIRPIYGNLPFWGIITGSYSNFMAAYIISLLAIPSIFSRNLNKKQSRLVFYAVSVLVCLILMYEEISPFYGVSKVYDIYDIIASGLGSLFAIFTFEIIIKKKENADEQN